MPASFTSVANPIAVRARSKASLIPTRQLYQSLIEHLATPPNGFPVASAGKMSTSVWWQMANPLGVRNGGSKCSWPNMAVQVVPSAENSTVWRAVLGMIMLLRLLAVTKTPGSVNGAAGSGDVLTTGLSWYATGRAVRIATNTDLPTELAYYEVEVILTLYHW